MDIINKTDLTAEQFSHSMEDIPQHQSLIEVYGWYHKKTADTPLSGVLPIVINQDEYSIDVLFPWHAELVVVYGVT
jgi:hypothetical protein